MYIVPFHFWLLIELLITAETILLPRELPVMIFLHSLMLLVLAFGVKIISLGFFVKTFSENKNMQDYIALTFDDGPNENITPEVLSVLKKHSVKATFFMVAERAKKSPKLVETVLKNGHEIASHDLTHSPFSNFRLGKEIEEDIKEAVNILEEISGVKITLYRPPIGLTNPHYLRALSKHSLKLIGWSLSAKEAGNRRLSRIKKIHTLAKGGAVVLLHDTLPKEEYRNVFLSELELLIEEIKKQSLKTVTVSEMFFTPELSGKK